jgi:hypothetical protein
MRDSALMTGTLIIAALFVFGIYKGFKALFGVFPESSFRTFMLSTSGSVFTFFVSLLILVAAFMFAMMHSGIQC